MTRRAVVLALDLGTSSLKALAVNRDGAIVASATGGYPTARPETGAAEQVPRDWQAATIAAIAALPQEQFQVAALAVTGQMHGTVLLGADSEPLAPAIIWSDQRSAADAVALNAVAGGQLRTVAGSAAASGFQAATIRWLRREHPDLWDATQRVLLPKDELIAWLTGEAATDASDAAGAWLLDSERGTWSPELCAAAGVDRGQLPPVVRPGTVVGTLLPEIAARIGGLPAGIPVVTGGGDAPCGALGAGIVGPDDALIMLSTGAQVIRPATSYAPPGDALHLWPAALPAAGTWNRMGATLNAGVAIEWLKRLAGERDIERLAAAASDPSPPLFLPWLTGERDPAIGAGARAAFLGLTAAHTPADLAWATLEGIAFSLVPTFAHVCGSSEPPARVLIAGGGSRLATLVRLLATALDTSLIPCEMADLTALGAAMLGAHALGWLALPADAAAWRRLGQPVEPDATMREVLRTRLAVARDLNGAIQPVLQRLGTTGTDHATEGAADR